MPSKSSSLIESDLDGIMQEYAGYVYSGFPLDPQAFLTLPISSDIYQSTAKRQKNSSELFLSIFWAHYDV